MTDYPFDEPGEPGELKGSLRAKDLVNRPCVLRVMGEGEWPAKPAEMKEDGTMSRPKPAQRYFECDVAVLGVGGIEDYGSGVRVSWGRVIPQLEGKSGWIPCRPKQEDDRSIILVGFNDKGKAEAAKLMPEIEALFVAQAKADAIAAAHANEAPYDEGEFNGDPF